MPDRRRILHVAVGGLDTSIVAIAPIGVNVLGLLAYGATFTMVLLASDHLRIVRRRRLVEHHNVLMLSQWHFLRIKKTAFENLIPDDVVAV